MPIENHTINRLRAVSIIRHVGLTQSQPLINECSETKQLGGALLLPPAHTENKHDAACRGSYPTVCSVSERERECEGMVEAVSSSSRRGGQDCSHSPAVAMARRRWLGAVHIFTDSAGCLRILLQLVLMVR